MNIYCLLLWKKTGFSKFGSYTGNGNTDGTFVYTGFKPKFVIIKRMFLIMKIGKCMIIKDKVII